MTHRDSKSSPQPLSQSQKADKQRDGATRSLYASQTGCIYKPGATQVSVNRRFVIPERKRSAFAANNEDIFNTAMRQAAFSSLKAKDKDTLSSICHPKRSSDVWICCVWRLINLKTCVCKKKI